MSQKVEFRERVINVELNRVILMEITDKNHFEEGIDRQEFAEQFNLDLQGALNIVFEPDHQLYMIRFPGDKHSEIFDSPEDHPVLKQIYDKQDEIINTYKTAFLEKRLPKFHVMDDEGDGYFLPEENEDAYDEHKIKREAREFLWDTDHIVLHAIELGQKPDPEIVEAREHARNFLGAEELKRALLKRAGLMPSPGSEAKIQRGEQEPVMKRLAFLPDNVEKRRKERKEKRELRKKEALAEAQTKEKDTSKKVETVNINAKKLD